MISKVRCALLVAAAAMLIGIPSLAGEKIRIGWQPHMSYPQYHAMLLKLFEKEGLEPEWIKFEAGPPMLSALKGGDLDVTPLSTIPAMFALAGGVDAKIFLVNSTYTGAGGLVARKGSGIKGPADQRGKKIGATFGSSAHYAFLQSLKTASLTDKDVTFLNMGPSVIHPAFVRGDIDGAWIWEPWVSKLEEEGGTLVSTYGSVGGAVSEVWLVRTEFLRSRPEAIQKFLRGYDMGFKTQITSEMADRMGSFLGMSGKMLMKATSRLDHATMETQLTGHIGSMGTMGTRGQSPLYNELKSIAEFLYAQKKIDRIPDLLNAIEPGPVEQYLKTRAR